MPTYRSLAVALAASLGTALAAAAAAAADFRVDNTVSVVGQPQPQSQSVTIFHEGLVYDFLAEPAEITVFDKAQRRFILLDVRRRLRSEILISDVQEFTHRAKQRLTAHPNPGVKWLASPAFEEVFDHKKSLLTLKGPWMTYQAQVQATSPEVAAQYHDFSDWYTQFNHVVNPKSWPPFARMMLNEALDRRQGIAKEVHLTAQLGPKDKPTKVASRHELTLELDANDNRRIAEARQYLQDFQVVSFREYHK